LTHIVGHSLSASLADSAAHSHMRNRRKLVRFPDVRSQLSVAFRIPLEHRVFLYGMCTKYRK